MYPYFIFQDPSVWMASKDLFLGGSINTNTDNTFGFSDGTEADRVSTHIEDGGSAVVLGSGMHCVYSVYIYLVLCRLIYPGLCIHANVFNHYHRIKML